MSDSCIFWGGAIFYGIGISFVVIVLIVLIVKRIRSKREEDFEKRSN